VKMESKENCGVCGVPLVYATESVEASCAFCGAKHSTLMYCPEGHYVCDSCHGHEALDVLCQALDSTSSTSPLEILERVMSHPSVPMHGPEHHAMVPAAIVAAVQNAGYQVPDRAVEKAIARGSKVPGGWCGSCGVCGAAIGVGIAVSVLGGATPLTGGPRALANEATAFALFRMLDGQPRCCKKASRKALTSAVDFLRDRMGIALDISQPIRCTYMERNRECVRENCPYYSA
jgi:hypothetical protein